LAALRRRLTAVRFAQYSDDEADSSPRRRGSSPDDAYTEDESDVDRDDFAAAAAAVEKRGKKKDAELVGPTQFKDLVVPRTKLAEFCAAPWFEEWVKGKCPRFSRRADTCLPSVSAGAWVRFLIGPDDRGQPTYRLCEVQSTFDVHSLFSGRSRSPSTILAGVKEVPEEPYRVELANTSLQLELRFAKNVRFFKMENVSNSAFTDVCPAASSSLPSPH
jgi:RNA polymerase-associated protein RTF1